MIIQKTVDLWSSGGVAISGVGDGSHHWWVNNNTFSASQTAPGQANLFRIDTRGADRLIIEWHGVITATTGLVAAGTSDDYFYTTGRCFAFGQVSANATFSLPAEHYNINTTPASSLSFDKLDRWYGGHLAIAGRTIGTDETVYEAYQGKTVLANGGTPSGGIEVFGGGLFYGQAASGSEKSPATLDRMHWIVELGMPSNAQAITGTASAIPYHNGLSVAPYDTVFVAFKEICPAAGPLTYSTPTLTIAGLLRAKLVANWGSYPFPPGWHQ